MISWEAELRKLARELLKIYGALDDDKGYRLKILLTIYENEGISFNELKKKLKIEEGLLAYHLAVLKATDLIAMEPCRKEIKLSCYRLTEKGKIVRELLSQNKTQKS